MFFFVCECVRLCVRDELMSIWLQNTIKGVRFFSLLFFVSVHIEMHAPNIGLLFVFMDSFVDSDVTEKYS